VLVVIEAFVWGLSPFIGFSASLSILMVLGYILALVGFRKPGIGLLGIGILVTLDALTRNLLLTGGLLRFNTLNYFLLIVMVVFYAFLLRVRDPHSRLLQALIVVMGIELIISPNLAEGVQVILSIVTMFGILVYFGRAAHEYISLLWVGVVNGSLGAFGGLAYYLQIDRLPYIDPNSWAFFPLTALISICIGFPFANRRSRIKLFLIILAGLNLVWIFLSASRGNMLVGLTCLLYLLLASRSLSWTTLMLFVLSLMGLWVSTQFISQQSRAIERIRKTFDTTLTLRSRTSGRSLIAEGGLYLVLEEPLGVGTGGYRWEVSRFDFLEGRNRPAHAAWIQVLGENGFLGFLLLISYVFSFLVVGWRKQDRQLLLLGALTTAAFAVSFFTTGYQDKSLWFLAASTTILFHKKELAQQPRGMSHPSAERLLGKSRRIRKAFLIRQSRHSRGDGGAK